VACRATKRKPPQQAGVEVDGVPRLAAVGNPRTSEPIVDLRLGPGSHEGALEFSNDGSRSLFAAIAVMSGLTPLVRDLETQLAVDVK
jgi:hypothetical protein